MVVKYPASASQLSTQSTSVPISWHRVQWPASRLQPWVFEKVLFSAQQRPGFCFKFLRLAGTAEYVRFLPHTQRPVLFQKPMRLQAGRN